MLRFLSGDMFEHDADIRVNTVNCVGVMGAGVALEFKRRYPAMFANYRRACQRGEVQPGKLHIWTEPSGTRIVNFPTKQHWRQGSRYEYIEAGLASLRQYLLDQGPVRVTLPALGCGHGGLDWTRVSKMIQEYLGDLDATILVFEPGASRWLGKKARRGLDQSKEHELTEKGIRVLRSGDEHYPRGLEGQYGKVLYVRGMPDRLTSIDLAILPSGKPGEREIQAARLCVRHLARPDVTISVGYGSHLERPAAGIALEKGAEVVIMFSEGIERFQIRRDIAGVWDEGRVTVVSVVEPEQRWSTSTLRRTRLVQLKLARGVLITDPSLETAAGLLKAIKMEGYRPAVFHIDYGEDDRATLQTLEELNSTAIKRDGRSGRPKVEPILKHLESDTV